MSQNNTRQDVRTNTAPDQAWKIVREWPALRLSALGKLAWQILWSDAGARPATVHTSPNAIGAALGGDRRNGNRAITSLVNVGLIELVAVTDGRWTVYLVDPSLARSGHRLLDNPQRELDLGQDGHEGSDDDQRAEVVPLPPAPFPSKVNISIPAPLPSLSLPSPPSNQPSNPFSAAVLNRAEQLAAGDVSNELAIDIAKQITKRVRDPKLHPAVARRVADAIADGSFPRDVLRAIFDDLDHREATNTLDSYRWCYFVGSIKKQFKRLKIEWRP